MAHHPPHRPDLFLWKRFAKPGTQTSTKASSVLITCKRAEACILTFCRSALWVRVRVNPNPKPFFPLTWSCSNNFLWNKIQPDVFIQREILYQTEILNKILWYKHNQINLIHFQTWLKQCIYNPKLFKLFSQVHLTDGDINTWIKVSVTVCICKNNNNHISLITEWEICSFPLFTESRDGIRVRCFWSVFVTESEPP